MKWKLKCFKTEISNNLIKKKSPAFQEFFQDEKLQNKSISKNFYLTIFAKIFI